MVRQALPSRDRDPNYDYDEGEGMDQDTEDAGDEDAMVRWGLLLTFATVVLLSLCLSMERMKLLELGCPFTVPSDGGAGLS